MSKIKAVIFDLDGTIADTVPLCIKAFRESIEPLVGYPISDDEIVATFGPSEEGTIMALAPNNYQEGITNYLFYYQKLHEMCPTPFDGIIELLNVLQEKAIRLAMVTGKGKFSTDISLQKFGITHYFEIIETGHISGPRKEDGIKKVMNFFEDITPDEIIYIGDAPTDILACRNVGIAIAPAAWSYSTPHTALETLMPQQLFYKIEDLKNWLVSRC